MRVRAQSVLWFLGTCLVFSFVSLQLVLNWQADTTTANLVVGANWGSLLLVVAALTYMYHRDPAYLAAESGQVVQLAMVRGLFSNLANETNPTLLKALLSRLGAGSSPIGETVALSYDEDAADVEDMGSDASPDVDDDVDEEADEHEDIEARLREILAESDPK